MPVSAMPDPNLEAAIEHAVAPYVDLLGPDELEDFREVLREQLLLHPVSARLLKQLAPPPVVQRSGDLEVPCAAPGRVGSRRAR